MEGGWRWDFLSSEIRCRLVWHGVVSDPAKDYSGFLLHVGEDLRTTRCKAAENFLVIVDIRSKQRIADIC
jgi:hypothetical protein